MQAQIILAVSVRFIIPGTLQQVIGARAMRKLFVHIWNSLSAGRCVEVTCCGMLMSQNFERKMPTKFAADAVLQVSPSLRDDTEIVGASAAKTRRYAGRTRLNHKPIWWIVFLGSRESQGQPCRKKVSSCCADLSHSSSISFTSLGGWRWRWHSRWSQTQPLSPW